MHRQLLRPFPTPRLRIPQPSFKQLRSKYPNSHLQIHRVDIVILYSEAGQAHGHGLHKISTSQSTQHHVLKDLRIEYLQ